MTIRLPALVDVHVHMREPGGEHKETWDTGTAAALAGGIGTILAMPNTDPAIVDEESLDLALEVAGRGARTDFAHFVGASIANADRVSKLADRAAGLKMYLGQTFGDLRLDDRSAWRCHLENWPADRVISVHAEGPVLRDIIELAAVVDRPVHICHVASEDDITAVADAKHRGEAVTCEVAPHHLFLDQEADLSASRAEVRPRLARPEDRRALWSHLETIDCFATDHAPHTLDEKDAPDAPPGFPGVETMVPLLLTAVHEGRLELDDVIERLHSRPIEIFDLPNSAESWVEIDPDAGWQITAEREQSRCGWTPFEGMSVRGRVERTVVNGVTAYENGRVIAAPGSGRDVREEQQ